MFMRAIKDLLCISSHVSVCWHQSQVLLCLHFREKLVCPAPLCLTASTHHGHSLRGKLWWKVLHMSVLAFYHLPLGLVNIPTLPC